MKDKKTVRRKKRASIVGWREWVSLPDLGIGALRAKTDTGAKTSALHAEQIHTFASRGTRKVAFVVPLGDEVEVEAEAVLVDERIVRSSSGEAQVRPVIETRVGLGRRRRRIEISLTDRGPMGYLMLLGRSALRGLVVDPSRSFVLARPGKGKKKRPRTKVKR